MTQIAEIVTFRIADTTSAAQFARDAQAMLPFLTRSGGLISRTLSVDPDGLWSDHILWASMADATRAAEAVMAAPEAAAFMAPIQPDSVHMRHAAVHLTQT